MFIKNKFILSCLIKLRDSLFVILSRKKWRKLKYQRSIMLEIGAGEKSGKQGWTTVDLRGSDIAHDLRRGIPLPNNTVDKIYTSHLFEHIPYKDLISLLEECYRVLKKGGELSVCVPNAGYYIRAYYEQKIFRDLSDAYQPAVVDTNSFLDQVNYVAYMDDEHKYMFDEENLVNTLKVVPFEKVSLRDFDPDLDRTERDFESVYARATK